MALSPKRWQAISQSQFPWEREALEYIREGLPDHDPYRAWSNFEFISDDGTINEVDLLVLTPQGFFLVEIKSSPGTLSGSATTWVWTHEGHSRTDDNPLFLANRKAKKLASLLKRQKACAKVRFPFLEPLIFCSHPELKCHLQGVARNRVCLRDRIGNPDKQATGILSALKNRGFEGAAENVRPQIDRPVAKAIAVAMDQAGIRPSHRSRRVGDYILGNLLYESPTGLYQDWEATHSAIETAKRRVRIYNIALNTGEADREAIKRAAQREYRILDSISHPGILQVESFTEHELGPALIFRHDPRALRFDHYLSQYGERLDVGTRLNLIRQIAEAIKYAHEKRIVHRALAPQSILVIDADSSTPRIKIFNWQTSYREGSTTRTGGSVSATAHPEKFIEDISAVYLPPEAEAETDTLGEHLDIFSLGAIAYHIFSGKPPADNAIEMAQRIRDSKGLQISAVLDGAGKELQELIQFSTHPEVFSRLDTVADFLAQLDYVEEELTRPDEDAVKNPADVAAGDALPGGFKVTGRLGSGSSAVALLVVRDGRECVLKIANNLDFSDRLRAEAQTIRKLRHPNIVEVYEDVEINGLAGFTMQKAGEMSLGKRLRAEGRLSLDFLERFGEDLLDAVRHLEDAGVQHRDIKPDNIGVRPMGRGNKERLVLFDFSLSQTPLDNIRAGTEPYLDPFLLSRKPMRWDLAAERFAAAMTLYEMATGTLPKWGDGQSHPSVLECEATLNAEFFDPNLRDRMLDFFEKALRRDYRQRFDNADEMLRAWRHIFEAVDQPAAGPEEDFDIEAAISNATLTTQVITLGLSTRAANALDRLNVITVKDLLIIPLNKIYKLRGVGNKTRREIAALVGELRERFPDIDQPHPAIGDTATESESAEPEVASVDLIAQQVARVGSRDRNHAERKILHAFIGWDAVGKFAVFDVHEWPSQSDVARFLGLTRARVGQVVTAARQRWQKNASVKALRKTIAEIIEASGGAMVSRELITAVLAARGSSSDEPMRSQLASVITRAAVEAECNSEKARFIERHNNGATIIARDTATADYVERLGRAADKLAELDPVPTPARTIETLRGVAQPDGLPVIADSRIVQLAVAASTKAAVSPRLEIYPKAMPALKALKLAHGALLGASQLTIEEIRQRVQSRYPEAEPLPDRPELDTLLAEVELDLQWSHEKNAYAYSSRGSVSSLSSSTHHVRYRTQLGAGVPATEVSPEIADARVLENKLRRANDEGAFLALVVEPTRFLHAEKELVQRFSLERRSLDEMLIRAMREQAEAARINWQVVLQADGAGPQGKNWNRLLQLVDRGISVVEQRLAESSKTVLLVYPGLLARYSRLNLLERLRDQIGTSQSLLHGLWVLLAADHQSVSPMLNGKAVPVIGSGQLARIPEAWIYNHHRSNGQG